jgi:hypothetical protein
MDPYFEYDYITYNTVLGSKTFYIIYIFSQVMLILFIIRIITVYLVEG